MLFLEPWFWAFATIAVVGFWVCPSAAKLGWLLLASAVFQYHFAGPAGIDALAPEDFLDSIHVARSGHRKIMERLAPVLEAVVAERTVTAAH